MVSGEMIRLHDHSVGLARDGVNIQSLWDPG